MFYPCLAFSCIRRLKNFAFLLLIFVSACSVPEKRTDLLAFTDFKIIGLQNESITEDEVVIVKDDSIYEVLKKEKFNRKYEIPDSAIIRGKGKFLMPALADMHAHFQPKNKHHKKYLHTYLDFGVTQIRVMAGDEQLLAWKDSIKNKLLTGPDLKVAAPLIDGEKPLWGRSHNGPIVNNIKQVDSIVSAIKAQDYDLIKLYERLPEDVYFRFLKAAEKHEIKVAAHIPFAVLSDPEIPKVFNSRSPSFEHFKNFGAFVTRNTVEEIEQPDDHYYYSYKLTEDPDPLKIRDVVQEIKKKNIWICPTVVLWKNSSDNAITVSIKNKAAFKNIDEGMKNWWLSTIEHQNRNQSMNRFSDLFLKEMARQKVKLLVGTDFPNPFILPGLAVHQEIHHLTEMGYSELEALRAATLYPVQYWENSDAVVYFKKGRLANFLILNENPMENIKNTLSIDQVIHNGKPYSP